MLPACAAKQRSWSWRRSRAESMLPEGIPGHRSSSFDFKARWCSSCCVERRGHGSGRPCCSLSSGSACGPKSSNVCQCAFPNTGASRRNDIPSNLHMLREVNSEQQATVTQCFRALIFTEACSMVFHSSIPVAKAKTSKHCRGRSFLPTRRLGQHHPLQETLVCLTEEAPSAAGEQAKLLYSSQQTRTLHSLRLAACAPYANMPHAEETSLRQKSFLQLTCIDVLSMSVCRCI